MKKLTLVAGAAAFLISVQACEIQQDPATNETASEQVSTNAEQQVVEQIMNEFNTSETGESEGVQAVDYNSLKEFLNENLAGFDQTSVTGERVAVSGFSVAQARAEYQRGEETLSVKVLDIGTLSEVARKAMTSILSVEIEKDDDTGFQRTMDVAGHKAFVDFVANANPPELAATVFAHGRFLLEIDGHLDPPMLESIVDELDLDRLKNMVEHAPE